MGESSKTHINASTQSLKGWETTKNTRVIFWVRPTFNSLRAPLENHIGFMSILIKTPSWDRGVAPSNHWGFGFNQWVSKYLVLNLLGIKYPVGQMVVPLGVLKGLEVL